MSNQQSYFLGGTQFTVGLSAAVRIATPLNSNGIAFIGKGAAGTLWLAPVEGATAAVGTGAQVPTQPFQVNGPARFWLSATGATVTAYLGFNYSSGLSQYP